MEQGGDLINNNGKNTQKMFDIFCRKVLINKLTDFHRNEVYRRKWEIALDEVADELDEYFVKEIKLGEYGVEIQDDDLWELLIALPQIERHIMLLYALGLSDQKISNKIGIPRRTVSEKRRRILKKLREELERRDIFGE